MRSTQGDMRLAPAGRGRPWSRRMTRRAMQRPPPAESPAKTIVFGSLWFAVSSCHFQFSFPGETRGRGDQLDSEQIKIRSQ